MLELSPCINTGYIAIRDGGDSGNCDPQIKKILNLLVTFSSVKNGGSHSRRRSDVGPVYIYSVEEGAAAFMDL